jgi:hypothetical protein
MNPVLLRGGVVSSAASANHRTELRLQWPMFSEHCQVAAPRRAVPLATERKPPSCARLGSSSFPLENECAVQSALKCGVHLMPGWVPGARSHLRARLK